MDIYEAFHFINSQDFNLDSVYVTKINPLSNEVDDDESLNTKIQVWIEVNKHEVQDHLFVTVHYWMFDDGGDTFEEAVIKIANNIKRGRRTMIDETTEKAYGAANVPIG